MDDANRGQVLLAAASALALLPGTAEASDLHQSVQTCDIPLVRQLLASAVPLNEVDTRFDTPLHVAVRAGKPACVYLLLRAGANPYPPNRAGQTADLLARKYMGPDIRSRMVALLENPGLVAPGADSMDFAVLRGMDRVVEVLLEAGEDPNAADSGGRTPLHQAALKGRLAIVQLLLDHGANLEARDRGGSRPLHDAALGGDADVVRALLLRGADVSATNSSRETALHLAASWGRYEAVRALLEARAGKNARDLEGRTPLDLALRNGQAAVADLLRASNR